MNRRNIIQYGASAAVAALCSGGFSAENAIPGSLTNANEESSVTSRAAVPDPSATAASNGSANAAANAGKRFPLAFNTATIMGYHLTVVQQIELVRNVGGFSGFEPWHRDIKSYLESGGSLPELKQRLTDAGLTICGLISFPNWAHNDPEKRREGLDVVRECADYVAQLGGASFAAPVLGCHDKNNLPSLRELADRYRAVCDIAAKRGVSGALEVWGPIPICSTLADALYVAAAAERENATLLLDAYHLYRGAGPGAYESLMLTAGNRMSNFHLNDFPAGEYNKLNDSDRVLPGEGIAPLKKIQDILYQNGYRGFMSLEIFNKTYWNAYQPEELMKICRQKMEAAVE